MAQKVVFSGQVAAGSAAGAVPHGGLNIKTRIIIIVELTITLVVTGLAVDGIICVHDLGCRKKAWR